MSMNTELYHFFLFIRSASSAFRDSLMLDFGSLLMSNDSLWEFGVDYLQESQNDGKQKQRIQYITRIALSSKSSSLSNHLLCRFWCNWNAPAKGCDQEREASIQSSQHC